MKLNPKPSNKPPKTSVNQCIPDKILPKKTKTNNIEDKTYANVLYNLLSVFLDNIHEHDITINDTTITWVEGYEFSLIPSINIGL